jgi:phage-related protein
LFTAKGSVPHIRRLRTAHQEGADAISRVINNVPSAVGNATNSITEAVRNVTTTVAQTVTGAINTVTSWVSGLFGGGHP